MLFTVIYSYLWVREVRNIIKLFITTGELYKSLPSTMVEEGLTWLQVMAGQQVTDAPHYI